jgi:hypothetical protein
VVSSVDVFGVKKNKKIQGRNWGEGFQYIPGAAVMS